MVPLRFTHASRNRSMVPTGREAGAAGPAQPIGSNAANSDMQTSIFILRSPPTIAERATDDKELLSGARQSREIPSGTS
jgi:hypothetical protein